MEAARLTATIDADAKSAEDQMKSFGGSLETAAGHFKNLLATAGGFVLGSGIVGGLGMIRDQLTSLVDAGKEAEVTQSQTIAVLNSTKDASGMTAQSVKDLADHFMGLTGAQSDAIQSGENILLGYNNISGKVMPQATQAALDLSQRYGIDLVTANKLLGRSLEDPAKGMNVLSRYTGQLSDAQKASIKQFQAQGDTYDAQMVLLNALNAHVGGAAEAYGKTFAGSIAIAQAQIQNAKENIGGALIPVLAKLMTSVAPLISQFGNDLPGVLSLVTGFISGDVMPAVSSLSDFVSGNLTPVFGDLVDFAQSDLLPILQTLWGVIQQDVIPVAEGLAKSVQRELLPPLEKLGGQVLPLVSPALRLAGNILKNEVGPGAQLVIHGISGLLTGLTDLISFISGNTPVLIGLGVAVAGVGTALAVNLIPPMIASIPALAAEAAGWIADAGATLAAAAGEIAAAAPFIAIGAGIALVIVGVVELIKHWGDVMSTLGRFKDWVEGQLIGSINLIGDAISGIGTTVSGVFGGLWDIVKAPINLIITGIDTLISGLDKIQVKVPDWSPIAGGKKFGINIPLIPQLASGGDVSGPFYGGEAGPELLVRPGLYSAPPGSHVFNAQDTARMLSGLSGASGGPQKHVTINNNIYPAKAQFGPDELDQVTRRAAFLSHTGGGY